MTGGVPAALASGAAISAVMGVRRLDPAVALARVEALRGSIRRMDRCSALGTALARAGVPVAPDVFLVATLACAGSMGVVAWTLVRSPVVSLVAAAAVGVAGWSVVASAERRYLDRFSSQLPVVAQQLAGAIGAGLSLRQAIARAARDAPEPAASELRALSADLELGARIDTALQDAVARLPDPGLRTMVTAIIVQRVVGGDLARALTDLAGGLEQRTALEREARSATAQARMSAWLVAGLPLAGGVLVEIASPGTLARTIGHGPGLGLLIAATALQVVGVVLIRRIVQPAGTS
jgi:tight adherence protein B